jgi:DNA-binding response OmpR family regulator
MRSRDESGREALKNIETIRYNLALVDVRLQDMNGLDLLKTIKTGAKSTPVITITGLPFDETRRWP